MLEGSEKARTFVAPIQSRSEIEKDEGLKFCIDFVKVYEEILSDVRIMEKYNDETEELNRQEAWNSTPTEYGSLYLNDKRINSFCKKTKEHLSNLKELLNDEKIKTKIQFYFLHKKALAASFTKFVFSNNHDFTDLTNALSWYNVMSF